MTRSPLRLLAALALSPSRSRRRLWRQRQESGSSTAKTSNGSPRRARRAASSSSSALLTSTSSIRARRTTPVASRSSTPPSRALRPRSPTRTRRSRRSLTASRRSPTTARSVTVKLKKGVKFGPPVNREIQAKDVKYAFERAATKNVPNQYTTYFNFIEGYPKKPGALQDIPGIVRRQPVPDHVQADQGPGPGLRRVADPAGHHSGPEGVRGEVRQGEPVDVQRARRLLRPVHGRERRVGQARRLQGRQVDPPGSQPELEQGRSTSAPRTSTRSTLTTNATDANVAGRQVLPGQNLILDTNPPAQVLKRVVQRQKDQLVTLPGGGFRWFPLNTSDQAAGQHQRPQGDPRRVRPHAPPSRRAAARSSASPARTSSRRASAGSRRPVARRAPGSTSWPTRRATWPWPRST